MIGENVQVCPKLHASVPRNLPAFLKIEIKLFFVILSKLFKSL